MKKTNFSLEVELVNAVGLYIVRATLINGSNERYQAMGSHSSSLIDAQSYAMKKVYKLAGISKAGVTDE